MVILFSILLIPSSLIVVIVNTINGYFRSEKKFGITNIINLINSLIALLTLCSIFIFKNYIILPIAPLAGNLVNLILLIHILPKGRLSFDTKVFKLLKISLPLIIGGGFGVLNNLVDKGFASTLRIGQLALLGYAFLIYRQFYTLLTGPVSGASFAYISDHINKNENKKVQERLDKILKIFFSFFIIAIILFMFFGKMLLKILFFHGEVTLSDIDSIYKYTLIYLLCSLFNSIISILVTIFYSFKITVIPMLFTIIGLSVNILLNWLFVNRFGAYALAASSVASSIIAALLFSIYVKKKFNFNALKTSRFIIMLSLCSYIAIYIIQGGQITPVIILINILFFIYISFINRQFIQRVIVKFSLK